MPDSLYKLQTFLELFKEHSDLCNCSHAYQNLVILVIS